VVEQGPAAAIFEHPRSDYTRALLAAAFELKATDRASEARPRPADESSVFDA